MDVAQAIVDDLQAPADQVAGKHVALKVEAGKPLLWTAMLNDGGSIAAEIDYNHTIVVHNLFCSLRPEHKAAVIAHEIGHLIDFAIDPTPIVFRLPQTVFNTWHNRPMERAANNYAKQLIEIKHGDPHIIDVFEGGGDPVVVVAK